MIKYIVKLSYHYFEFENAMDAMNFAQTAKRHYMDKKDDELDVEIRIVLAKPVVEDVEYKEEKEDQDA